MGFGSLGKWAGKAWGAGKGFGGKAANWYSGLGSVAQHSLLGAGTGAIAGGFGVNPLNTIPFAGDFDAGGFFGGAVAGGLAGAAFGKFGAGKNLYGRGTAGARKGLAGMALHSNGTINKGLFGRAAGYGHEALIRTNKHGDKMLAGLAAGSAGLIGGSILSTNSAY